MISKAVIRYDLEGHFLARYKSLGEASRQTGITRTNIGDAAQLHEQGTMRNVGDSIWMFETDENPVICGVLPERTYWTEQKVYQLIEGDAKGMTLGVFMKKYSGAYKFLKQHGMTELIDSIRTKQRHTFDECYEAAQHYDSQKAMKEAEPKVFAAIKDRGWQEECFSHMVTLGSKAKRGIYAYEFPDNSVYVGLTFNFQMRHSQHLGCQTSAVYIHAKSIGIEIPQPIIKHPYTDVKEAQQLEGDTLQEYIRQGWKPLNRTGTGGLGGSKFLHPRPPKWTLEKILEKAKGYTQFNKFELDYGGAVESARKNGWIDQLNALFPNKRHNSNPYTKADLDTALADSSSYSDFRLHYEPLYRWAFRKKLLPYVRNHFETV